MGIEMLMMIVYIIYFQIRLNIVTTALAVIIAIVSD